MAALNQRDSRWAAVIGALPLPRGAPVLLAFTRDSRHAAAALYAEGRAADLDVRLLGLGRWDAERLKRNAAVHSRDWPQSAARQMILLVDAPGRREEIRGLAGFSVLLVTEASLDAAGVRRPGVSPGDPHVRDLSIRGAGHELLRLRRCLPLRWGTELAGPGGQVVCWPAHGLRTRIEAADGEFRADSEWQISRRIRGSMQLANSPVRLVARNGTVTWIECPDPQIDGLLRRAVLAHGMNRIVAGTVRAEAAGRSRITITVGHGEVPGPETPGHGLWLSLTASNCVVTGQLPAVASKGTLDG
jgi:hypothetical protein